MWNSVLVRFLLLLVLGVVAGCATPKHTNTLIFGTSTRVAIDISQEPTGAVGLTLGYKRHEAVWMPLLANKENQQPASCTGTACDAKFLGKSGTGGAAGAGGEDTYSVLATFSGQTSTGAGGGSPAQLSGGLSQFFATGFAARLFAVAGGAALVNTNVNTNTDSMAVASLSARDTAIVKEMVKQQITGIDVIINHVKDQGGAVDSSKLSVLLNDARSNEIPQPVKDSLHGATKTDELRRKLLLFDYDLVVKPLSEAIPK